MRRSALVDKQLAGSQNKCCLQLRSQLNENGRRLANNVELITAIRMIAAATEMLADSGPYNESPRM